MGNTCTHPHTHHSNHHQHNKHNYYVAKEQSASGISLASNRTELPGNSTSQGNSTTATKFQRFQIEEKHVAPPSIVAVTRQGTIATPSKIQPLEIEEKDHVVPPTENPDQSGQTGITFVAPRMIGGISKPELEKNVITEDHVVLPTENSDQSGQEASIKLVVPRLIGGISKLELEKNVITVSIASQADEPLVGQSNEDKKTHAITATEEPPTFEGDEKNTSSDCRHVSHEEWEQEWEQEDRGKDLVLITNERDECPTCLEGYDEENPKIVTKCNHHYHLGCIFEWMERSATCPMCFRVMEFQETS